jgi:hypothetical protein
MPVRGPASVLKRTNVGDRDKGIRSDDIVVGRQGSEPSVAADMNEKIVSERRAAASSWLPV